MSSRAWVGFGFFLSLFLAVQGQIAPVYAYLPSNAPAALVRNASSAELASEKVYSAFFEMSRALQRVNSSTAPQETKALRKLIVAARDHLDLFYFVYPHKGGNDPWLRLRELLDEGYEFVGEFKDLYDSQMAVSNGEGEPTYDSRELNSLRKKVLDWRKVVLDPRFQDYFSRYLKSADGGSHHERGKKDLSRFYWGAAGIEPDLELSGIENLSVLVDDLAKIAKSDFKAVIQLSKLWKEENAEAFHDFRKRIRSICKIVDYFPLVLSRQAGNAELMRALQEISDRYGEINDLIVAYGKAVEDGKEKQAEKLKDRIWENWDELLEWQEEMNVPGLLILLRNRLS